VNSSFSSSIRALSRNEAAGQAGTGRSQLPRRFLPEASIEWPRRKRLNDSFSLYFGCQNQNAWITEEQSQTVYERF
jgi:hypothetical protein